VKPLKRGGGRRYYRPEDVLLLRRIRQCLYQDGYTIKGVQRLLREGALKNMPIAGSAGGTGGVPAAEAAAGRLHEPAVAPVRQSPPKAGRRLPPLLAAMERSSAETVGEMQNVVAEVVQELVALRDLLRRGRR
jgi:DNA-binding transcriptional MerR regulator